MNKAINSFLKFVPDESWIQGSCNLPWLKLDICVPGEVIIKESDALYSYAVEHRSQDSLMNYTHQGWRSLALYGVSAETTQECPGKKVWTSIAERCPKTVEFIKTHWEINESTGRIRFMWLDPGGYILPHNDRSDKGFYECNVAVNNPHECRFRFMNFGTVPFENNSAFLVDISNKHFVVNQSNQLRTHLIVHASLKSGILKSSYEQNFYS
jgi:hypothetical protein